MLHAKLPGCPTNPGTTLSPSTKRNGHRRLSYLMAPRLRPLLTPPNHGTQMESKLDLRMALKKGQATVGKDQLIGRTV